MNDTDAASHGEGVRKSIAVVLLLVVLVAAGWAWWQMRSSARSLADTQGALELQVLTSRLGAAALEAEYGNYEEARQVMSGVYDGIQNHGIEEGSLPENFAQVLRTRDEVITALAREDPGVTDRLVELFFRLQIPVDTELSPEHIIPAADSGIGMEPPSRRMGAPDSLPAGETPDTVERSGKAVPEPADTAAAPGTVPPGPRPLDRHRPGS